MGDTMEMGDLSVAETTTDDDTNGRVFVARNGHEEQELKKQWMKIFNTDAQAHDWNLADYLKLVDETAKKSGWAYPMQSVAWKDLTVTAEVGADDRVQTVGSATINLVKCAKKKTTERVILNKVSGYCHAGQTLLILGPPGSGCSTLLAAICDRLDSALNVKGEVLHNGKPLDKNDRTVGLIEDADEHIPVLSVYETVLLAARMATPLNLPFREQMIHQRVKTVLQVLGIYHVRNTIVGDDSLRGVSGGEKKRVTIAEHIVALRSVICLDGYTTGLDASAALDIAKTLKLAASVFKQTIICTQYQASQQIFEVFDNVAVMKQGHCVYFGPCKEAQQYFLGLGLVCPTSTTMPDFLTEIGGTATHVLEKFRITHGEDGDTERAQIFVVKCHYDVPVYIEPKIGSDTTGNTIAIGTLFSSTSAISDGDAEFVSYGGGWIMTRKGEGVNCASVKTDELVLHGAPGKMGYLNGIYDVSAEAPQVEDHPVFVKKTGVSEAFEGYGGKVLFLYYDTAEGVWAIGDSVDTDAQPFAVCSDQATHPGAITGSWRVLADNGTFDTVPSIKVTLVSDSPVTAEDLTEEYTKSHYFTNVQAQIPQAVAPVNEQESHNVLEGRKNLYAVPASYRLKILVGRELAMIKGDPATLPSRIGRFVIIGLVLMLLYRGMDQSQDGLYSRAGFLFFALLFAALGSFGFLPNLFDLRPIFYKHRNSKLYDPFGYYVAVMIVDIPIIFFETFIFSNMVYWLPELNLDDNGLRFLYFWICVATTDLLFTNFSRGLASIFPERSSAQALGFGIAILYILFGGFLIPRTQIGWYFRWIHYASPIKYALEAIFINEYDGLVFSIDTPDGGVAEVLGNDYLAQTFDMDIDNPDLYKWMVILINLAFATLFGAIAIWGYKNLTHSSVGGDKVVYARKKRYEAQQMLQNVKARRSTVPVIPQEFEALGRSSSYVAAVSSEPSDFSMSLVNSSLPHQDAYMIWQDVTYEVDLPHKRKEPKKRLKLLNKVDGYVRPGMMVALMGSSGAGKTTLLDVLAKRKTGGYVHGDITINGVPQDENFSRFSGYVEQTDIHVGAATIREAFTFSARLRLDPNTRNSVIVSEVLRTAQLLELEPYLDAIINGLSTDVRKRVTIGVELVSNPSIIFMDEPTSGLDTAGAITVITAARRIADMGRCVVCTVHQPSSNIFLQFDYLLLLQRGGHTAYFGPIGPRASIMLSYFESQGCDRWDQHQNPADYMLEQIGAGLGGRRAASDFAHRWGESEKKKELTAYLHSNDIIGGHATPFNYGSNVAKGLASQTYNLLIRTMRTYWRTPSYNFVRQVFAVLMGLLLGLTYFDLGDSQGDLRSRTTVIYFSSILSIVTALNAMPPILEDRSVFYREKTSGYYQPVAYFFSSALVEIPFILLSGVLFAVVMYWLVGLRADAFPFFLLTYLTFQTYSVYMGQAFAVWAPNLQVAQMLAPAFISLLNCFSGFLIRRDNIPKFFIQFYYFNPFTFFLGACYVNEIGGETYTCEPNEIPCYTDGDDFLDFYSLSADDKWIYWGIIVAFAGFFRFITFLGLQFKVAIDR